MAMSQATAAAAQRGPNDLGAVDTRQHFHPFTARRALDETPDAFARGGGLGPGAAAGAPGGGHG